MVNIEGVLAAPYSSAAVANAVRAAAAAVRASTVDAPYVDAPYFSYAVAAAVRASTVATPYSSFLAAVRREWRPRREWRVAGPSSAAAAVRASHLAAAVRAYASSSSAANSRLNRFAILALLADDGEFSHLSGMTSTNTAASFANPPIFDDFDINLPSTDASPKKTLFENGEASATTFINKLGKVTPEFVDEQKGPEGVQVTGEDDDGYAVVRSRKYGMLRGKYPEGPHVDSSVDVCHNEIPFATIVGSRRKVRKCFQSRKGGRARSYMGLGFYVFGSYGPDSLEF